MISDYSKKKKIWVWVFVFTLSIVYFVRQQRDGGLVKKYSYPKTSSDNDFHNELQKLSSEPIKNNTTLRENVLPPISSPLPAPVGNDTLKDNIFPPASLSPQPISNTTTLKEESTLPPASSPDPISNNTTTLKEEITLPPASSPDPISNNTTTLKEESTLPPASPPDPISNNTTTLKEESTLPPASSPDPISNNNTTFKEENALPGDIPRNEKSTIATDITRIWHNSQSGSVCVHLKEDARCPHPALVGRLSGPALAILDWKEMQTTTDTPPGTVLCGDYSNKWLDAGEYFLEIIVLLCEDYGVGAFGRISDAAWFNTTVSCVEDAMHNRITSDTGSTITISSPTTPSGNYRLGRWIRKEGIPLRPLFTRSQPRVCFGPDKVPEYKQLCNSFANRDVYVASKGREIRGLPEYEFQWGMNISESGLIERFRERLNDNSTHFPKICGIGDSHSRYMTGRSLRALNLEGMMLYVGTTWPDPDKIQKRLKGKKCEKLFVQVGQWPASHYSPGGPFSFGKYHEKLKLHVQNVLKTIENNPIGTVYLPTLDQCPLMGRITACTDWRSPATMDGYSLCNQMIEQELNTSRVKYVDTNFIIYTHWDGHGDWQHLQETVRSRKTIFMAAIMLGELDGLDLD
ncbi:unnamed protein product [Cylindrotheca closterium]|uniref:Uncharacterized protein n=1 Tax=Cylindrotheca closterium TaxID=2856 RepID=A0AAD2FSM6_9STRA|nr:unnamed protein product [Cylindrotheca closterium]